MVSEGGASIIVTFVLEREIGMLETQRDQILLEGWIHRREESYLISHVGKWHTSPSALVKGQKVFILPIHRYEAEF